MYKELVNFIQELYGTTDFIPLHEPRFRGNEKKYVMETLESSYVSSIGKYVTQFEEMFAEKIGVKFAIATSSGTSALHISLLLAGVDKDTEVLTQSLTFVATCNAISYLNANPHFIDVDKETFGMSPEILEKRLSEIVIFKNGFPYNKYSGKRISACMPMHTFGHPCKIDEIVIICNKYSIPVVEDAAEALGSYYKNKHIGSFGKLAAFSFNGNKIITSGGGGVIVTNDEFIAKKAKHLTTTAKKAHTYEYVHDEIGYNYRLPNLNAALLVAQLEQLDFFLKEKRKLVSLYDDFFREKDVSFVKEPKDARSNYWLNSIILKNKNERDEFLNYTNNNGVMTRPIWKLMSSLEMYKDMQKSDLSNSKYLEERVVNIPSSVI